MSIRRRNISAKVSEVKKLFLIDVGKTEIHLIDH